MASVLQRVIDIAAWEFEAARQTINADTHLGHDLAADSLDTLKFILRLEQEFQISIPNCACEKIRTIGQAVRFIQQRCQRVTGQE